MCMFIELITQVLYFRSREGRLSKSDIARLRKYIRLLNHCIKEISRKIE